MGGFHPKASGCSVPPMTQQVVNFNAGPAGLPRPVLERAQAEFLDFAGTGISVMEHSHRGKAYEKVHFEAIALTKELLGVPDTHAVLFVQGGASQCFATVPMNFLLPEQSADYVITGTWSKKALSEAKLIGQTKVAGTGDVEGNFIKIPKQSELKLDANAAYCHITSNNTIAGTQWHNFPNTGSVKLVADLSSDIMWKKIDVSKFGLIYAGAQKNLGPSGLVVALIRDDFLAACSDKLASMLQYKIHADKNSLYNTPPCFSIYILRNVLAYNKSIGGLAAIERNNRRKGELLYGCIDRYPAFYKGYVTVKDDRSFMNVDFNLPSEELDAAFVAEAKKSGMVGLKGYRSLGGVRVSTYNAVTVEQVETLVAFMEGFAQKHA